MKLLFTGLLAALCFGSTSVAASLIGSQVTVVGDYPTLGSAITNSPTATVSNAVEFPVGALYALAGFTIVDAIIDVGPNTIDVVAPNGGSIPVATFNGLVFTFDAASPTIIGVSLDATSTVAPVLGFGPHEVTVNDSGVNFAPTSKLLIDLNLSGSVTPTPEPNASKLLLAGIALFGFMAVLKRRASEKREAGN